MDVSARTTRARALYALLAVAGVLVVAGVVGIASGDGIAEGNVERPADGILDLLFSFGLVLIALTLVGGAIVYALGWHMRLRHGRSEAPASPFRALAVLVLILVPLACLVYLRRGNLGFGEAEVAEGQPQAQEGIDPTATPTGYEPEFTTVPVLIAAGAVLAALVGVWLSHRSRRRALGPRVAAPYAPTLDEVLGDTLDDLRFEPDPRRAVIAAYARLERALSSAGYPRARSDAPGEYLGRVLREATVAPAAVARLTALFARAKFSEHEVGEPMRTEAIEALQEVREDLRAAEEARGLPVLA